MRPSATSSRSQTISSLCVAAAVLMLIGAVGPWARVGPSFTLYGLEGLGFPLFLLGLLTLGVAGVQLVTGRRSLYVLLAILGLGYFGASALVWTVLKVFSGSTHVVMFVLARGAHQSAFANYAPTAAWGLWLMPLAAALLVFAAIVGASTRSSHRQDSVRAASRHPLRMPRPGARAVQGPARVGEIEQPPPGWR